jgi:hypothetical protein
LAYLWLGAAAAASVAITRADLACAWLENGDVDGAIAALEPVFELTEERRLAGVTRRMSQLRALLGQPRYRSSAVASILAGRFERFRTDLATLVDGHV